MLLLEFRALENVFTVGNVFPIISLGSYITQFDMLLHSFCMPSLPDSIMGVKELLLNKCMMNEWNPSKRNH